MGKCFLKTEIKRIFIKCIAIQYSDGSSVANAMILLPNPKLRIELARFPNPTDIWVLGQRAGPDLSKEIFFEEIINGDNNI